MIAGIMEPFLFAGVIFTIIGGSMLCAAFFGNLLPMQWRLRRVSPAAEDPTGPHISQLTRRPNIDQGEAFVHSERVLPRARELAADHTQLLLEPPSGFIFWSLS